MLIQTGHIQTKYWLITVTVTDNGPDLQPEVRVVSRRQDPLPSPRSNAFIALKRWLAEQPDETALKTIIHSEQWRMFRAFAPKFERTMLYRAFNNLLRFRYSSLGDARLVPSQEFPIRNIGEMTLELLGDLLSPPV